MADHWAAGVNGDEDDDEALRIAIALSLGEDPRVRPDRRVDRSGRLGASGGVIDLTQEDDDGDGRDGDGDDIVLVDGSGGRSRKADREPAAPKSAPEPEHQSTSTPSAFSAFGLDRKKMEEERLARLSKRKASALDDVQSLDRATQRPRIAAPALDKTKSTGPKVAAPSSTPRLDLPLSPRQRTAGLPSSSSLEKGKAPSASVAGLSSSSPNGLPFPQGVVKKTWAFGQPRHGDDIKIEEVLQKQHLQLAVLSSYQWDEEWMLSKVDLARTKLVLIAFAVDEAQKEEMRANVPRDRIRFCFPPMQGIGAMHSKLMLLKYEKYMRIVVPTGNLMSFDWGETGTMENMAFIIDLPKFQSAEEREAQKLTPFAEELFYFLGAQGLDEKLVVSLRNYDFAETRRYRFVHTIPGSHTSEDAWRRTGYCGLGRAVGSLGLASSNPIELDFVCASLGAVNYSLLTALYNACRGDSGLKEYESRTSTGKGKRDASVDEAVSLVKAHMRIFFPSRETVVQSKGGKDGAGTICFQSKWWQAATFPRELLRDCESVRAGLLMHSKVMYVRRHDSNAASSPTGCYAYVGSANLSESAWGRLVRDRTSSKPKLTCRNWECGVLVPVQDEDAVQDQAPASQKLLLKQQEEDDGTTRHQSHAPSDVTVSGAPDLRVFEGRVPILMEWPGRRLVSALGDAANSAAANDRRPWFHMEA